MAHEHEEELRAHVQKGHEPTTDDIEKGYQPRAGGPVDPTTLKPPQGGSAIQRPRSPAPKDSSQ